MNSQQAAEKENPYERANPFSKLFFCWLFPLFRQGFKNDLETKDLYSILRGDVSEKLGDALERNWLGEIKKAEEAKKTPQLRNAISKTFLRPFSVYGLFCIVEVVILRISLAILLGLLIEYFNPSSQTSREEAYWLAFGVVVCSFSACMLQHHNAFGTMLIGMRCRIACCSLIYRKLLRLSKHGLSQTTAGHLVNLMSNDVARFDLAAPFLHYFWVMPLHAAVCTYLMYHAIHTAALVGIAVITIQTLPLQGILSRLATNLRKKVAQRTDERVRLMSEIISGIQVIKMYAWEKPFEQLVRLARKVELNKIAKVAYIKGFSESAIVFSERFTLYITVVSFVLLGTGHLKGEIVFSLAQFFNQIQLYMAIYYPNALLFWGEANVSVKRIESFLLQEEIPRKSEANNSISADPPGTVRASKVSASWIHQPITDTLRNLKFTIEPGELVAVVGLVGAGKSSLLQLIMQELQPNSGALSAVGNVSYAAQEPWLFVSSVRNNILFGQPYDEARYRRVVRVCALQKDFLQLPHGDKTLIGERGVSLSGGQRARISLARAVYREADIYLMDDPLSAVDTHVAKALFEECVSGYLKGKTRILVTHQVHFLKGVDRIIVLNNGEIEKIGSYQEMSDNILSYISTEPGHEESPERSETSSPRKRQMSIQSQTSEPKEVEETDDEPAETQELMEKGAISGSVYKEYLRAGGSWLLLGFLVFLFLLSQIATSGGDYWVTFWTNEEELRQYLSSNSIFDVENATETNSTDTNSTEPNPTRQTRQIDSMPMYTTETCIYIYTVCIVSCIVLTTLRSLLFMKVCKNASQHLHDKMFGSILQAKMRFFDTNPSGRVLNRFSKDTGAVDERLPSATLECFQIFLVMFGILTMVAVVNPLMIISMVVMGALFYFVKEIYMATAQDLKRIEGVTRSPVFSHISATLNGITTIRSSKAQEMTRKEFDHHQDLHTRCWFLVTSAEITFGMYLDVVSTLFLIAVSFSFLLMDTGTTRSGDVGLALSQSLILTGMMQYGLKQVAQTIGHLTSVERILQYTKLDKEGPFESEPAKKPAENWPDKGQVEFKKMYLRYSETDHPVLVDLNISIQPGEKVGIVGRTGAGKSSLISALFRLAPIEGEIRVDTVNTADIGLHDLRSRISIIPQEPVLFSSTVRYNLDPLNTCTDEELWKALEEVELKDAVEKLEDPVLEGGLNFSAGQRQLVCLARAILRRNKILVLDEATANVDPQTDALIQKTIRRKFNDCTVLTIAHRLNTIMDSDKVLVMDAGQAVEFGHPHELLKSPEGVFTAMLKETGKATEKKLRQVAEEAFTSIEQTDKKTD